jgi:hypothetical protein
MFRRTPLLEEFERQQRRAPLTLLQKFLIYDGLLAEARQLGIIPLKEPLDGIEEDLRRVRTFRDL